MIKLPLDSIICHDVANGLPLPDECIDVVVTSPPYWGLRDYGKDVKSVFGGDPNCKHKWGSKILPKGNKSGKHGPNSTMGTKYKKGQDATRRGEGNTFCQICGAWQGQLGLEPHPQMFIDHLVIICREIKRVLKKSGSFYLNLGDTYCSTMSRGTGGIKKDTEPYLKATGKHGHKRNIKYDGHWLQPKQLMLMPSRIAIALQDDGWILRNDIIWHKPNPMPSSVKDRLNNTFEHVFYFVKSKRNYYDLDKIREPHKESSIIRDTKGYKQSPMKGRYVVNWEKRDGTLDQEFCHPAGKNPGDIIEYDSKYKDVEYGQTAQGFTRSHSKEKERAQSKEDAKRLFSGDLKRQQEYINYIHDHGGHPMGANPGDFWSITTQPFTGYNPDLEHFAVFPENLVLNPLKASCPRDVCKKCGKPRIRIIKTDNPSKTDFDRDNLVKATEVQKTSNPQSIKSLHRNESPDGKTKGVYYSGKTVGWSDCGCNSSFGPGVVLDPFCGRGTVGKVAKQLGLHYILFDIKPEYCELAQLYIGGQKHKLHKDQSKLGAENE